MAPHHHTPRLATTEEAVIVLFCLIDDAYPRLNPCARCYESLKRLSDSEVITLALVLSNSVACRASPPSCATPYYASSLTSSPGWLTSHPPRCTGGYAGSGASLSPCGVRSSCPSWWAIPRP